jgi:hypothetical protein
MPDTLIIIWHTPYKPPQPALGKFTPAEAAEFFKRKGASFDLVKRDLDNTGACDQIVGYHIEYDD